MIGRVSSSPSLCEIFKCGMTDELLYLLFLFTYDSPVQLTKERGDCVYNDADDNTVSACDKTPGSLRAKLSELPGRPIQWFRGNYMQANPSKFQYTLFSEGGKEHESNLLPVGSVLRRESVLDFSGPMSTSHCHSRGIFQKVVIKPVGS